MVKRFDEQVNHLIAEKAKELLIERGREITDKIYQISERVDDLIRQFVVEE